MPDAERKQVSDSSSLDEVAATSESGDPPGQWETCPDALDDVKLKGKNPRDDTSAALGTTATKLDAFVANPLVEVGTGHEHLTTATAMYCEMDMRFWLERAEAEMRT